MSVVRLAVQKYDLQVLQLYSAAAAQLWLHYEGRDNVAWAAPWTHFLKTHAGNPYLMRPSAFVEASRWVQLLAGSHGADPAGKLPAGSIQLVLLLPRSCCALLKLPGWQNGGDGHSKDGLESLLRAEIRDRYVNMLLVWGIDIQFDALGRKWSFACCTRCRRCCGRWWACHGVGSCPRARNGELKGFRTVHASGRLLAVSLARHRILRLQNILFNLTAAVCSSEVAYLCWTVLK